MSYLHVSPTFDRPGASPRRAGCDSKRSGQTVQKQAKGSKGVAGRKVAEMPSSPTGISQTWGEPLARHEKMAVWVRRVPIHSRKRIEMYGASPMQRCGQPPPRLGPAQSRNVASPSPPQRGDSIVPTGTAGALPPHLALVRCASRKYVSMSSLPWDHIRRARLVSRSCSRRICFSHAMPRFSCQWYRGLLVCICAVPSDCIEMGEPLQKTKLQHVSEVNLCKPSSLRVTSCPTLHTPRQLRGMYLDTCTFGARWTTNEEEGQGRMGGGREPQNDTMH